MPAVTSRSASNVIPRSVAPTAEPIRTGTVNACTTELHTELLELETTLNVLAQHLEPVSRAAAPEGKTGGTERPPATCSVTGTIGHAIDRIVQLRLATNAIMERLEIQ